MQTTPLGSFPAVRPRRLRASPWARSLVREHALTPNDLIWAIIVHDGKDVRIPVPSMPGVARMNVAEAARAAVLARTLGIPAVAVFPHVAAARKDRVGTEATNPQGIVCTAVRAMKEAAPEVGVMVDVALDPFTDHGHDGVLEGDRIVNDVTALRAAAVCAERPKATLPATVRCGKRAKSWKTMPMLRRSGGTSIAGVDTTVSDSAMVPARTGSKPATQRSSVLLPQPEGPRRQPISPGANAKERSWSTGVLP